MTRCPRCEKTWVGLKLEHCARCHETFTHTAAGDAHRVGSFVEGTRRCLSAEEMLARSPRPMARNDRGHWTFAANLLPAGCPPFHVSMQQAERHWADAQA